MDESIWDWNQLLDFNIEDHLQLPLDDDDQDTMINNTNLHASSSSNTNDLAGACPELDASSNKKHKSKTKMAFTMCQVPGCECGKFHVLSDFDEGRRSCRRKLERHNNRRRRKSSDPKGSVFQSADCNDNAGKGDSNSLNIQSFWEKDYVSCVFYLLVEVKVIARDVHQPGVKSTTSATAGEDSFVTCEGHNSVQGSTHAQTVYRDSITSLAGETHIDEERENNGDDNTDFSSMCPTGRISFKLYDWNPAEFPCRLRHQIFQWLASMPLELEGYIRPGCTILTIFIAMPKFMWVKLNEDPVHDLQRRERFSCWKQDLVNDWYLDSVGVNGLVGLRVTFGA
nr:hypothetical protein [Tanacetum cinerariifolium]